MKSLLQKIRGNHMLAMVLCCALPLGLIVMLSATGILGSWGYSLLMLLCPLLHVVMMRGHGGAAVEHVTPRLIAAPERIAFPEDRGQLIVEQIGEERRLKG